MKTENVASLDYSFAERKLTLKIDDGVSISSSSVKDYAKKLIPSVKEVSVFRRTNNSFICILDV